MSRLIAFVRLAVIVSLCWLLIGTSAMFVGLRLASAVGDSLAWVVYGLGIAVAAVLAASAPRLVTVAPTPRWLSRPVIACTALFVCQQFVVAGTSDWSPVPILFGIGVGLMCAVVTWIRTASEADGTQTALA